jgi:hypothetical protein
MTDVGIIAQMMILNEMPPDSVTTYYLGFATN